MHFKIQKKSVQRSNRTIINNMTAAFILGLAFTASQFFFSKATTAGVIPPHLYEDTGVLPQKIYSPKFKSILLSSDSQYNNDGQIESLSTPFAQNITFAQIIQFEPSQTKKDQFRAALNLAGIPESSSAGQTTAAINVATQVFIPSLGFGMTKKLSLGLYVPVYRYDIKANTGFVKTPAMQAIVDQNGASNPMATQDISTQMNDAINTQLTALGYHRLESRSESAMGDMILGAKYRLINTSHNSLLFKTTLALPTGQKADPDDVLGISAGDGQLDINPMIIYEHELEKLSLHVHAGYSIQTADTVEKRIPTEKGNQLSADKETVDRNIGDAINLGVGPLYKISPMFKIGSTYSYQQQNHTTYQGSKFSSERYRYLEDFSPSQKLQTVSLHTDISTIDLYRKNKFALPMVAYFTFSHILSGKNAINTNVFSLELSSYF